MKKIIVGFLSLAMICSLCSCESNSSKSAKAEDVLKYFSENGAPDFGEYVVYDETSDPNQLLGRPDEYITKADFSLTSVEQVGDDPYCATIETFDSKKDATARYDYINGLYEQMPALKEYMYQNGCVILRMDLTVTPSNEKEYENLVDEYLKSID